MNHHVETSARSARARRFINQDIKYLDDLAFASTTSTSYHCTQGQCEQIVHGQTITVFEGTLTICGKMSIKATGLAPDVW